MTFPFGTTGMGLTPIGVRPDHVITGANQRTLGAGNGERVGVDGWDRRKKVCKLVQKYHRWCFDILVLLAVTYPLPLTLKSNKNEITQEKDNAPRKPVLDVLPIDQSFRRFLGTWLWIRKALNEIWIQVWIQVTTAAPETPEIWSRWNGEQQQYDGHDSRSIVHVPLHQMILTFIHFRWLGKYLRVMKEFRPSGDELRIAEEPQQDDGDEQEQGGTFVERHRTQIFVLSPDESFDFQFSCFVRCAVLRWTFSTGSERMKLAPTFWIRWKATAARAKPKRRWSTFQEHWRPSKWRNSFL